MRDPGQVTACWRELASLSDLDREKRLAAKIPMTPEAVTARWRQVALLRACQKFRDSRPPEKDRGIEQLDEVS